MDEPFLENILERALSARLRAGQGLTLIHRGLQPGRSPVQERLSRGPLGDRGGNGPRGRTAFPLSPQKPCAIRGAGTVANAGEVALLLPWSTRALRAWIHRG